MSKKKQATPIKTKALSKFRFPAKNGRPAQTVEAATLAEATDKYNNPTQNV